MEVTEAAAADVAPVTSTVPSLFVHIEPWPFLCDHVLDDGCADVDHADKTMEGLAVHPSRPRTLARLEVVHHATSRQEVVPAKGACGRVTLMGRRAEVLDLALDAG
jgi:hypothetical protein